MSLTLETIRIEVKTLPASDKVLLWHDLGIDPDVISTLDDTTVQTAWDAEIAKRVNDVKLGKVELISGEEADRQTAAIFAQLGLEWDTQTA